MFQWDYDAIQSLTKHDPMVRDQYNWMRWLCTLGLPHVSTHIIDDSAIYWTNQLNCTDSY